MGNEKQAAVVVGSNRQRFEAAFSGKVITQPVYAVYDWFVQNRPDVDWDWLFSLGLGQINHATLVRHHRPNVEIVETTETDASGQNRRDIRWITDIGELHEWYLGEWRQEYLIKKPEDYRIMARALSDVVVTPLPEAFIESEASLGDNGITMGVPELRRTAFQAVQIDMVGLERFSLDIGLQTPELLELIEVMNALTFREFEAMTQTPARHIKLWENLTIETMGPKLYRQHLVPVYERIFEILNQSGQKLSVHYDGKLKLISDEIARLGFFGLDSLTPPAEGDMTIAEARHCWPDKFLWLHPCLGWHSLPADALAANVRQMATDAGGRLFCMMVSEEIPDKWRESFPLVLENMIG